MIINCYGVVFVALLLEVPNLYCLVHRTRYYLSLVKEERADEVIMRGELIDTSSRLKTEDIDVKVLTC